MSIDILSTIDDLSSLISAGIFLIVVIRAAQIRRALVSRIFRRRAFWIAAVGVFIMFSILSGTPLVDTVLGYFLPQAFQAASIVNIVSYFIFLVLILVIFAFVDSTVLAAIEMDFFHRDTLRWKQFRRPSYAVPLALLLYVLMVSIFFSSSANPPTWVIVGFILVDGAIAVVLGYSVATLTVAARRTPDMTMKRHVRLLGFVIACFAIVVVNTFTLSFVILNDLFGVVTGFIFYRTVMSLSPTSRIEKEIA